MEKQEIILDVKAPKKHSVCYKTLKPGVAVFSVYVMRSCMGSSVPKAIKITIEEA